MKANTTRTHAVHIDHELYKELKIYGIRHDQTVSDVLAELIRKHLIGPSNLNGQVRVKVEP